MDEFGVPLNDNCAASLEEKVGALRSPRAYDEQPRSIKAIETHYAWVFLADDCAYKLKKPMRMAYLDLSELAARQRNCAEELRLNRRLAPDVYLGIAALTRRADGSIHVGGPGRVVDWLVKMRRLPSALMLDYAMASGAIDEQALTAVGVMLARFYQAQRRMEFDPHAYLARLNSQIHADRTELLAHDLNIEPVLVETVATAQLSGCARLKQQLMQRAQRKRGQRTCELGQAGAGIPGSRALLRNERPPFKSSAALIGKSGNRAGEQRRDRTDFQPSAEHGFEGAG